MNQVNQNNKEISLIFDFNNIAMRALFTCSYGNSTDHVMIRDFSTDAECGVLIRKIAMDMLYIVRMVNPNKIIVCCDSGKSWRKSLLESEEVGYKENRKKNEDYDWNKIYAELDIFKKILADNNIQVFEIDNGEADDLAAILKEIIYRQNHNNIIYVTSDKDWLQLVDFDDNTNSFCCVLNPIANRYKKKPFNITQDFKDWTVKKDEQSLVDTIFNTGIDFTKDKMNKLISSSNIDVNIISPDYIVLSKVFCGDESDNIPSFYEFYGKNGKKTRITELKMKKIIEGAGITDIHDLKQVALSENFKSTLQTVLKKEIDDVDLNERMNRQILLVQLEPSLFPKQLVEDFKYKYNHIKQNGYITNPEMLKMDKFLENTKYIDKNYKTRKSNDIFDDLKDLEKYIKPTANSLF